MSQTDTWTIGRLLTWTTEFLNDRGSDSPRLDAELLLADARKCERIELYAAYQEEADEPVRTRFRELVKQRAEGMPVAYLLGHREFYSLSFRVTPDVLIPRPETEFVVVELLDRIAETVSDGQPLRIADIGTGSGVLAICAAKHLPDCRVVAVDISPQALDVARQNAQQHGVADRIEFVEGDLFGSIPATEPFDFVVSNPPYVAESELDLLAAETRTHEPRLALVAGPNGTEVLAKLIAQASGRLVSHGWLIVEISPMIETATRQLIAENGSFREPRLIKDLAQLPRVLSAQHAG